MALSRATVAKVSAFWNSWSPAEFACCAEKRSIYRPATGACYFLIGRGDKEFPVDQLTDPNYATYLTLVLPCNAVNKRILGVLWGIESVRALEHGTSNLAIEVVGDVGRDTLTGETRYSLISYGSAMALADEIKGRLTKENIPYLRGVLKMKLKGHPWKTTLKEINDFQRDSYGCREEG